MNISFTWPNAIVTIFGFIFLASLASSGIKNFFTYLNVRRHGWPEPGITIAAEDDPIITFKMPEGAHFTAEKDKKQQIDISISKWIESQKMAVEQIKNMTWPPGTKQYMDEKAMRDSGALGYYENGVFKLFAKPEGLQAWEDLQKAVKAAYADWCSTTNETKT